MHLHGINNVSPPIHTSASQQTYALVQRRAEETRRKLAASLFTLEQGGDGSRSGGSPEQERQARKGRSAEDGEFEHMFSALG